MFAHDDNNELDPIAFWVLLLLSGGQRFTFHDIVKSMDRPKEGVWDALQTLQSKKYVKNENSKFMIDFIGVEYLIKRGILASEVEDEPKPQNIKKGFKLPFLFSTWTDMFIWLGIPFVLTFTALVFDRNVTAGYNFISMDKSTARVLIWMIYSILLGLYTWRSYHYVLEHERIVVFLAGKAIGKKGPGHILLLPFIHNPKRVDLREKSQEIKKEPCITKDNMLASAGFYITWQIDNPILSLTKVSKVEDSMSQLSAAVLHAVIAEFEMEEALEKRRALNALIRVRIEHKAEDWGVLVNSTELHELQPPEDVVKSIENRFKVETQIETLRRLMAVGSAVDDRTLTIFNTLVNNTRENYIQNIPEQEIPRSTKEYLTNHPDYDLLRMELSLPSLVTIDDYYSKTEGVLKAIDFIYSLFAIIQNGTQENILELIDLISSLNSNEIVRLSNLQVYNILHKANIPPLLISSLKYASPVVEDLLGIGKTFEILTKIIKDIIWYGKYEKKIADIDIKSKEGNLERLELENQKLQLELIEKQLEIIEKGKNIKLSKKEKELLLSAIAPKIEIISKSDINPLLLSVKKQKGLLLPKETENDNNKLPDGEN